MERFGQYRWVGIAIITLTMAGRLPAADLSAAVRLNSIGFLPDKPKHASIAMECTRFAVIRAGDGAKVLEGTVSGPLANADTREQLYIADFSTLRDAGEYWLEAEGVGRSATFRIGADVYNKPLDVVMRGMYLWRCGVAVKSQYNGKMFEHAACHLDDAWLDLVGGGHVKRGSTGGWHDAGDYNKYVVNAGVTVGAMLRAWDDFGERLKGLKLGIPESGGPIPDFLAEIKWEIDWLLTMQAEDGSVHFKVTTKSFGGFIMPELERTPRYFTPWGSAGTADFVAMTASASRYFRPYDAAYADRLLAAARKSYAFLQANPQNHAADPAGVTTGGYGTSDPDERLWAAAELWESTGDAAYLTDLETRIRSIRSRVQSTWDWGDVANLGIFTYALSKREGRDAGLVRQVQSNITSTADQIVAARNRHGYARPLGTTYYWGCNGTVARQAINLMVADRISPRAEYPQTALDALGYLFGRNSYNRSFVTGLGHLPPLHPHDRRSGGDKVDDPWPGYLVGGQNGNANDWQDDQDDYRTNEIAINWNGALIYALAAFAQAELEQAERP